MTDRRLRELRLAHQRLSGAPVATPEEAVRWLTAVQAQDFAGAKWALALRTREASNLAIDTAFDQGRILRTHLLRPTWHLVAPADIKWLLALTAPRVHAFNAYQYRAASITAAELSRSRKVFESELRDGRFRTRRELADALARRRILAAGHRLSYFMMHAELEALICSGPRRGNQFTYALLDERAPAARTIASIDEALGELASRYMQSHGPATLRDFAWWSGLTRQQVTRGVQIAGSALQSLDAGNGTLWMSSLEPTRQPKAPTALLLPNYDEYFIAYKDRTAFAGNGPRDALSTRDTDPFSHVLAIDGRFAGTWQRALVKKRLNVDVKPVKALTPRALKALRREAARLGAFIGAGVDAAGGVQLVTRSVTR